MNVQLLAEGELLPGLAATEFALRRQKLAQLLPTGSVAIVPAAPVQFTSPGGRIPHAYRQVWWSDLTAAACVAVKQVLSNAAERR